MNLTVDLLFLSAGNFLLYGWATSGKLNADLTADDARSSDSSLGADILELKNGNAPDGRFAGVTAGMPTMKAARFSQLENQIAWDLRVAASLPLIK